MHLLKVNHLAHFCVKFLSKLYNFIKEKYFTYIFVFEKAQHFEFPEYSFGRNKRLKYVGKFFKCNTSTISWICDSPATINKKKFNKNIN